MNSNYGKSPSSPDVFPPPARRFGGGGIQRFGPTEKARDKRKTLSNLMRFYAREGKALVFVFFLLLGSSGLLLFIPRLVGQAVDNINLIKDGMADYSFAMAISLIILGSYVFDWFFSTVQGFIMAGTSQRIVKALRRNLFNKIQKLPLTYHDTHAHGEIMSRLTNDIDNISTTIAASTTQLMNSVVTVLGSLIFMLILSPALSIVTLVTLPLVLILTKVIAGRSRKMFVGQQIELGHLNGIIEETISGLRMVKAFNQQENMAKNFSGTNEKLLYHSTRAQTWSGFLMPMMNVISNLGFAFVAGLGGILAVSGRIEIGIIASFITYSRQFIRPMNEIAGTFNSIQSALAGAERVFDVFEQEEEKGDVANAVDLVNPQGNVVFNNVCFEYVQGIKVLNNINFEVKKGQTIALVGATGAGKTTIVNLLTRFYDVSSGSISIDGKNIMDYTRESLRLAFTVVLQDTCLFTGTIADNIRYGKPNATMEEIVAAAKAANSDQFIKRLPQGYNTFVSSAVDSLSQGQRQLIAISRAVLCSAPILILDEATSSVDTSTEIKIQEALLKFREERTSFVIAHRLSTIKDADKILVVEGGEIIESGSHQQLLAVGGKYAKMYNSQFEKLD